MGTDAAAKESGSFRRVAIPVVPDLVDLVRGVE